MKTEERLRLLVLHPLHSPSPSIFLTSSQNITREKSAPRKVADQGNAMINEDGATNRRTENEFKVDPQKSSLAQKVEPEYTFSSLSSSRAMLMSKLSYNSDLLISCHINTNSLLFKHRLHMRHCIARHQHCPGQSISILILTPNRGESF
jgi:hypothetical protein